MKRVYNLIMQPDIGGTVQKRGISPLVPSVFHDRHYFALVYGTGQEILKRLIS